MDLPVPFTKPPLGLRPRVFALEDRAREVAQAITRYTQAGLSPKQEWRYEYRELIAEIERIRHYHPETPAQAPVVVQVSTVHRPQDWDIPEYETRVKAQLRAEMARALEPYGMADRDVPVEVGIVMGEPGSPSPPGTTGSIEDPLSYADALRYAASVRISCTAEIQPTP